MAGTRLWKVRDEFLLAGRRVNWGVGMGRDGAMKGVVIGTSSSGNAAPRPTAVVHGVKPRAAGHISIRARLGAAPLESRTACHRLRRADLAGVTRAIQGGHGGRYPLPAEYRGATWDPRGKSEEVGGHEGGDPPIAIRVD